MKKFEIDFAKPGQAGYVVYDTDDCSFDARQVEEPGFTSVVVDDLNLEIDAAGKVLFVWGLCPHTRWEAAALEPPDAPEGELRLVGEPDIQRGVSIRLTPAGMHRPTFVDRHTGWVMIRNGSMETKAVRIMPGVLVELDDKGSLCTLWIRPENGVV